MYFSWGGHNTGSRGLIIHTGRTGETQIWEAPTDGWESQHRPKPKDPKSFLEATAIQTRLPEISTFPHSSLQLPPDSNDFLIDLPRLMWECLPSMKEPWGEEDPGKCSSWHLYSEDKTLEGGGIDARLTAANPGKKCAILPMYLVYFSKTFSWRSQTISPGIELLCSHIPDQYKHMNFSRPLCTPMFWDAWL